MKKKKFLICLVFCMFVTSNSSKSYECARGEKKTSGLSYNRKGGAYGCKSQDFSTRRVSQRVGLLDGDPPLSIIYTHQNFSIMSNRKSRFCLAAYSMAEAEINSAREFPTNFVKSLHRRGRSKLIKKLCHLPFTELIEEFMKEIDAKNHAYHFILEHVLLDAFNKYCFNKNTV